MTLPIIAEPLRFDCKLDPGPSLLVGGNFCIFDEVVAGGGEPYHTIPWEEVNRFHNSQPLVLEHLSRCGYEAENNNIGRSPSYLESSLFFPLFKITAFNH